MQRKSYLVGFIGAVAMLSLIASLEVEVAAARGTPQPVPVNRALKGDRLLPASTKTAESSSPGVKDLKPAARAADPKLPEGCRATFSTHDVFAAEVAGRCVS